ncbi:MAG: CehA/McbA family metallohydrolase [Candidatus Acidiferrales bacterium]
MRLPINTETVVLGVTVLFIGWLGAANTEIRPTEYEASSQIPLQVVAYQARRLELLLDFLGQPFSQTEKGEINLAIANRDSERTVEQIQSILDRHTLVVVTISQEGRVGVARGEARADLTQDGWRIFFVKIVNQAGVRAPLKVDSPNSGPVFTSVNESAPVPPTPSLSAADTRDRWAVVSLLQGGPVEPELPNDLDIETRIKERIVAMYTPLPQLPDGLGIQESPQLTGSGVEYRIILIYSRDAGQRTAELSFATGQGLQDIGKATVLFNIEPSRRIKLHVLDYDGRSTTASFIFRDVLGRTYPNPLKRSAPDFYFEPQVYRADGQFVSLPQGSFTVTFTGGPEYTEENQKFIVNANGPQDLTFHLNRWIKPADYGFYSGDDHIHGSGCADYPQLSPKDMEPQVLGEHLNVASVLNWRPDYYYQRRFFEGQQDDRLSTPGALLHYAVEVSGFPSSHSGHLVLLNLTNQDYPGAKRIEDWPSWELPIIRWAKSQGATVGFAHVGGGFALGSKELPNYEIPLFDEAGAVEFVVDVTYPDSVDFLEAGNGPFPYDLNLWYHTLNVGFRTRIVGGTDFPCIYDTRVGMARTYAKVDGGKLTYSNWLEAIRDGAGYVSDGRSHLMDFMVNGTEVGTRGSEVDLPGPGEVRVEVKAAAYLDPIPDEKIRDAPFDWEPYWDTERARIGDTRTVPVEVISNGEVVARQVIVADGSIQTLKFSVPIGRSSWIAVRIVPSSQTNPIFVILGGKPIRASRRSAEWCLAAVEQSWDQQAPEISAHDLPEAEKAYEHARQVYKTLIDESKAE